ncbi:GNAT family N-acetyltransferase [Vibrio sp. WXL210]|uniref:GNAT family N-acetyltransferase n=1 Tax=Vibrio sp. WXL210 TaxID=3450709 RepID=UPI003EC8B49A
MKLTVSAPQDSDLNAIQGLTIEWGHSATLDETERWVSDIQKSPNHEMYLARLNDVVCGWIVVEKRIFLGTGYKGEITALVVDTRLRQHGIGKVLVNAAEQWAKSNELKHLVVRSNIDRNESHRFYSRTGFTFTKTAHNYQKLVT